jgi:membrane protein DedA with SNARE-associated domain
MDTTWTQDLLNWVSANPGWTGVLVFLVACVESLVVIGILVPGIFILFGVGAMIGMGVIDLAPIWIWGSLGALLGDLFSYAVGRRYREHLVDIWPFSRYPSMLQRGTTFFNRHGAKSVIAGRFIGPLRPVIPATAGMMGMTPGRFIGVDVPASIIWSPAYLLPGMLFGASLEVATEYAGRLSLVLIILAVALWITWWIIWAIYEFLVRRSARWLGQAVNWSRRHPVLGRLTGKVLDPSQPEALSVAMLGALLVILIWSLVLVLFFSPFAAHPEAIDQSVMAQALALRNHLADPVMVAITQMSSWWVLLTAPAAVMLWLFGAGRINAAVHWLVAIVGGVLLQLALGWTLRATPLLHSTGVDEVYIPSAALTLSTVVLGFFAVMVAGESRENHRKWSYMAAALLLILLLMARIYLGLDWLSGALVGVLLGFTWVAIVGIAYRLRSSHSFSAAVVSVIFIAAMVITMSWRVPQRLEQDLDSLQVTLPQRSITETGWWTSDWRSLPRERTSFKSVAARSFNAQLAIPLDSFENALRSKGWERSPQATWLWTMHALNPNPDAESLKLLGKDYLGRAEVLILRLKGAQGDQQRTIRVWDSGVALMPEDQSLYLVQVSEEVLDSRLAFLSYWRAQALEPDQMERLRQDLAVFESRAVDDGLLLFRFSAAIEIEAESSSGAQDAEPGR